VQRRRQAGAGGRPEAALSVVEAPIEGSVPGGGEQQGSSEMGTILVRDFPPARGQTEHPPARIDGFRTRLGRGCDPYNAARVGVSASGNGTSPSSHETTPTPSPRIGGVLFAKYTS